MTHDFDSAAKEVLHFLHERLGFALCMVTRTEGDDWIVLGAEDHGYGVKEGTVFRWADSFCSRMVEGLGPQVAPRAAAVPAYVAAPIGKLVEIGAYVGVPLRNRDGSLFGTLCAMDHAPQSEALEREEALVEMLANLLSCILAAELRKADEARRVEKAEAESMRDALTSLYSRRGWDQLLEKEEKRCQRYGHPACVFSIDLNNMKNVNDTQGHAAGDELLKCTGQSLLAVTRLCDVVARVGGDEFAILAVECDQSSAQSLMVKLRSELDRAGIKASFGLAMRDHGSGLEPAWREADQEMYRDKREKRNGRPDLPPLSVPVPM